MKALLVAIASLFLSHAMPMTGAEVAAGDSSLSASVSGVRWVVFHVNVSADESPSLLITGQNTPADDENIRTDVYFMDEARAIQVIQTMSLFGPRDDIAVRATGEVEFSYSRDLEFHKNPTEFGFGTRSSRATSYYVAVITSAASFNLNATLSNASTSRIDGVEGGLEGVTYRTLDAFDNTSYAVQAGVKVVVGAAQMVYAGTHLLAHFAVDEAHAGWHDDAGAGESCLPCLARFELSKSPGHYTFVADSIDPQDALGEQFLLAADVRFPNR